MPENQAAPEEPKAEERAKKGEKLLSLHELAVLTGHFLQEPELLPSFGPQDVRKPYDWKHCAAAVLHGWNDHERATVEPLLLSVEDYTKALDSIDPPAGYHTPVPHKPACSKYTAHDPDALAAAAKKHFESKKGGS